jgi:AcrR family transcriptional regulator
VRALAVLDLEGPGALSFRRVASELGASHMAVHRRCGNFNGLLELCAEHLAARLPEIDSSLPWAISTELRFTALYEALSSHWGLVALQGGRPWMGPQMMRRFSEPAVAASIAAGFTPTEISESHHELYVFTVGCALTRTGFRHGINSAAISNLDPLDIPRLSEHWEDLTDDRSDHNLFLHGIRTLIASWDPESQKAST